MHNVLMNKKRLYPIHVWENWLKTLIKNIPTKKERETEDSDAHL